MMLTRLEGCTASPLGSYLKALGVFRLISEQADSDALGWWSGSTFALRCRLSLDEIAEFFLKEYRPTPIVAPWNGGSGFYPKDRKIGIDAIAGSSHARFADYRTAIEFLRELPEVKSGKMEKGEEEQRRTAILCAARNNLPDSAVEWIDAAIGITSEGARAFPPILGTGGNEGRLDYTNNFMERLANMLLVPKDFPVRILLDNALFGLYTDTLEPASAGQFDPGRAGGPNQSEGVDSPDVPVNPWDLILTLEGAVAWAGGVYRRQGTSYKSYLCSPFTVYPSTAGYGSSSDGDNARAEIWAPLWDRPSPFAEIRVLIREGRASLDKRPARNGLEFAEAASSLGVDRGIPAFVRFNLLKRRGDSYIALAAGKFPVRYRSESDLVRRLSSYVSELRLPDTAKHLVRPMESAMFDVLLHGGSGRLLHVLRAFGRLLSQVARSQEDPYLPPALRASEWISVLVQSREARIAAAVGSIYDKQAGPIRDNLFLGRRTFAWSGANLSGKMMRVLERRINMANAGESAQNPLGASFRLNTSDATSFIEGEVDDYLIEDLIYAFSVMNWTDCKVVLPHRDSENLPIYALLGLVSFPMTFEVGGEKVQIAPDLRILGLLRAGRIDEAARTAILRLRATGLNPIEADYHGGVDPVRLGGALLIPVYAGKSLAAIVLHSSEHQNP